MACPVEYAMTEYTKATVTVHPIANPSIPVGKIYCIARP